MATDPGLALELLQLLIEPPEKGASIYQDAGTRNPFDLQLEVNMAKMKQAFLHDSKYRDVASQLQELPTLWHPATSDTRWSYVVLALQMLSGLKRILELAVLEFQQHSGRQSEQQSRNPDASAPPMSPDTLSFAQNKTLSTLLQFIVCLGVCPNLLPGVGVPLSMRSGFAATLQSTDPISVSFAEKNARLRFCTKYLLDCAKQPALASVILSRHLGDLLASLCQICHAPGMGVEPANEQSSVNHSQITCDSTRIQCHKDNSLVTSASKLPSSFSGKECIQKITGAEQILTNDTDAEQITEKDTDAEHIPDKLPSKGAMSGGEASSTSDMEGIQRWSQEEAGGELQHLVEKLYTPLVVQELLVLQGGPHRPAPPRKKGVKSAIPALPPAPVWLRHICGQLLTSLLIRPNGVQNVLRGMLQGPPGATATQGSLAEADWRKCDAMALVLANCPQRSGLQDYYIKVGPQIVDLLKSKDKRLARQFLRVAMTTISAMQKRHPSLTERYIWKPLLGIFQKCMEDQAIPLTDFPAVVVDASVLQDSVATLHQMAVVCEPGSPLLSKLLIIAHPVFMVFCCCDMVITSLQKLCLELLSALLSHATENAALSLLRLLALDQVESSTLQLEEQSAIRLHSHLEIVPAEEDGLHIQTCCIDSSSPAWMSFELRSSCCMELLMSVKREGLAAQFFVSLMKELTSLIAAQMEEDNPGIILPLSRSPDDADQLEKFRHNMTVLCLLGHLCEQVDPQCFSKTDIILDFVEVTLEHGLQVLRHTQDETMGTFESETVTMAMGLLTALLGGAMKLSSSDKYSMERILPLLKQFAREHTDPSVQEMAEDLQIAIATHGAVIFDIKKDPTTKKSKPMDNTGVTEANIRLHKSSTSTVQDKPLVEVISETTSGGEHLQDTETKDEKVNVQDLHISSSADRSRASTGCVDPPHQPASPSPYQQALKELADPLLPVRGHALIALRKLIESRDTETLKHQAFLQKAFLENLNDADSYLYLGAVNALAALAEVSPEKLLPVLIQEYASLEGQQQGFSELRLKLGEVIVKTSRALGDTIPHYRDLLLSSALTATRDSDPLIRASAVSNLGELCKLLRFSLGSVLQEILNCIGSLVKSDPEVPVRRAAAMFAHLLFQGVGKEAVTILGDVLKDLYKILKLVLLTEKDEMVQVHVQLALEELDNIMRGYLFPPQTFSKRIRVLDPE